MSIRELPGAPAGRPSASVRSEILARALDRWNREVRSALTEDQLSLIHI